MTAARPTAAEAVAKAQHAIDGLKAHEDLCALRYQGIEAAQRDMKEALKELRGDQRRALWFTVATLVTACSGLAGAVFVLVTRVG
jgi:hypothetical protein